MQRQYGVIPGQIRAGAGAVRCDLLRSGGFVWDRCIYFVFNPMAGKPIAR